MNFVGVGNGHGLLKRDKTGIFSGTHIDAKRIIFTIYKDDLSSRNTQSCNFVICSFCLSFLIWKHVGCILCMFQHIYRDSNFMDKHCHCEDSTNPFTFSFPFMYSDARYLDLMNESYVVFVLYFWLMTYVLLSICLCTKLALIVKFRNPS